MVNHPTASPTIDGKPCALVTLKGDWMDGAGYIDNANRPHAIDLLVVGGRSWLRDVGYDAASCSKSYNYGDAPLEITIDGDIKISGICTFSPSAGELDRVGLATPAGR